MNGLDIALGMVALTLLLMAISRGRQQQDAYLRRRIDALLEHLGVDPDAIVREEVLPLLHANRKMAAMRLYRQRTGADLQTAQQVVERWIARVACEVAAEGGAGDSAGTA